MTEQNKKELLHVFTIKILEAILATRENADHFQAKPFGPFRQNVEPVMLDLTLVIAGGIELLRDRVKNYARSLKEAWKKVQYVEIEGEQHGLFINDPYPELGNRVLQKIKDWMLKISG